MSSWQGSATGSLTTLACVTLVVQLTDGLLRPSAEQRLKAALRGQSDQPATNKVKTQRPAAFVEPSTARQRTELRALRLFTHSAECRDLLGCLALQDPACRVALEWLSSLAVVAVDGQIAGMVLQLAAQLPGALGAVLSQAATAGDEVIAVLQGEPQAELEALLDVLEPVVASAATTKQEHGASEPAVSHHDARPIPRSAEAPQQSFGRRLDAGTACGRVLPSARAGISASCLHADHRGSQRRWRHHGAYERPNHHQAAGRNLSGHFPGHSRLQAAVDEPHRVATRHPRPQASAPQR